MSTKRRTKPEGGGSEPTGGDEVFPDLHHKMSKKIAQLTKVIYHLNTKNEDHATMLETLDLQHKLELEQITKDSQSRMTSQKEISDMKQKLMIQNAQKGGALPGYIATGEAGFTTDRCLTCTCKY